MTKQGGGRRIAGWAAALAIAAAVAGCASQPTPEELERQNLMAAGEAAEARGDLDGALVKYVKLLSEEPENVEAHYRIGRVHSALGNPAIARDAYMRVLAKAPQHVGALEGLGLLYLEQGQRDIAHAMLHQALGRDQARWRAYNGLGVLADLDGKHKLAQAYFGMARKLVPGDSVLVNNLGYSHYLGGNLREAQRQFEAALSLDASNEKAWSNLGLVLTRQGQYEKAIQTLERIMTPSQARYSIGYICMLDGKLAVAESLFKDSIRRSKTYDPAAQAALKRVTEERKRQGDY
jgi:Flp pilus assembly protein TadD